MITTVCAIFGAMAALIGLVWKFWPKGKNHEAVEATVDAHDYDELDKYDRM